MIQPSLPEGVLLQNLVPHEDERGCLTELFRSEWVNNTEFVQWNYVESHPNTLRGVHVHPVHSDYLVVLKGTLVLGLQDLREHSSSFGMSVLLDLKGDLLQGAFIPPGVAHGFYFPNSCSYVYGVTDYWNPDDELGCTWNDSDINIPWPKIDPVLSQRDEKALSLTDLMSLLQEKYSNSPMYQKNT